MEIEPLPSTSDHLNLHRSRTAPALASMDDLFPSQSQLKPVFESTSPTKQALFLLIIHLIFGVSIFSFNRDNYSGIKTHPIVDALYFCIITMCTIGYGDIAPVTPATKLFTCFFVLLGFGFIYILLCGVMRLRMKVGLALGVVVLCIGTGVVVLYFVEELDWVDSIYLSVMSVTTVGYGDRAFSTLPGRLFASFWLLFSILGVGRVFLYLTESRIDNRQRQITKWVEQREITVQDFIAADVNNTGFLRKADYVIYKLKEMGKISDEDILAICGQFNKLDHTNSGRITLPDLLRRRLLQRLRSSSVHIQ